MRTYTVHHRLTDARDLAREVEGLVFVKEGFCWPGLFFPAFWLLFRGLWLVLIGYLVVAAAIVSAFSRARSRRDDRHHH
jgi:Zn-dependent protease with chaperone function